MTAREQAERAIGHPLAQHQQVHHHSATQFVICESVAYHCLLHRRTRVVFKGGNPNTELWCRRCHRVRPMDRFVDTSVCDDCYFLLRPKKWPTKPLISLNWTQWRPPTNAVDPADWTGH